MISVLFPSACCLSGDRMGKTRPSGSKTLSAEITHSTRGLATGREAFARFSGPVEDGSPAWSQHKAG